MSRTVPLPVPSPGAGHVTIHSRLTGWADRRFLPVVVLVLLTTDLAVGVNWTLSPPETLLTTAYDVAVRYAPVSRYGLVLLLLSTVAATGYALRGRCWAVGYALGGLLAGFWAFWTVIFALAPFRTGALLTASLAGLHVLAGLALSHRPPLQQRGADRS